MFLLQIFYQQFFCMEDFIRIARLLLAAVSIIGLVGKQADKGGLASTVIKLNHDLFSYEYVYIYHYTTPWHIYHGHVT